MCLHQFVYLEGTGIIGGLLILNVTVKVVGMEGAEQAAARPGLQPPHVPVVGIAHGAGPAHFHQRIAVGEQGQFALPAPAALFPHDPHVHIVGVQIQGQGTLVRFVAQQLPSYKPFHYLDFIVIGTLAGHTALPAILSKRPERDTGNVGTPKVRQEIAVQVSVQCIERNPSPGTGGSGEGRLAIHPTGFCVQVTEDHGVIDGNQRVWITWPVKGVFTGHQGQG